MCNNLSNEYTAKLNAAKACNVMSEMHDYINRRYFKSALAPVVFIAEDASKDSKSAMQLGFYPGCNPDFVTIAANWEDIDYFNASTATVLFHFMIQQECEENGELDSVSYTEAYKRHAENAGLSCGPVVGALPIFPEGIITDLNAAFSAACTRYKKNASMMY